VTIGGAAVGCFHPPGNQVVRNPNFLTKLASTSSVLMGAASACKAVSGGGARKTFEVVRNSNFVLSPLLIKIGGEQLR